LLDVGGQALRAPAFLRRRRGDDAHAFGASGDGDSGGPLERRPRRPYELFGHAREGAEELFPQVLAHGVGPLGERLSFGHEAHGHGVIGALRLALDYGRVDGDDGVNVAREGLAGVGFFVGDGNAHRERGQVGVNGFVGPGVYRAVLGEEPLPPCVAGFAPERPRAEERRDFGPRCVYLVSRQVGHELAAALFVERPVCEVVQDGAGAHLEERIGRPRYRRVRRL